MTSGRRDEKFGTAEACPKSITKSRVVLMNPISQVHAIVLAGGSGTRFWPLSRETYPKQMLQIFGEDTLLRQTVKRVEGFIPPEQIWIVATEDKAQDIRFHMDPLGPVAKKIQFINEPVGKNTAPAIGLAAMCLFQSSPESVMVVMPSDHAIPDTQAFRKDLERAIRGAASNSLVTFGIKPSRPETGYGYIQIERTEETEEEGLFKVRRFVEKPDLDKAKTYLSGGDYFWNSGIFVWKTSKILSEIEKHLPALYRSLQEMKSHLIAPQSQHRQEVLAQLYSRLESLSIDYGVMERSENVLMVPARFLWSDLGSWTALDEILDKDSEGNIFRGNTIDVGSQDSIVFAGERLVTTIGLKNMVVVDTPDATLVTPKKDVQEVRKIVEELKRSGREEHLLHKTVQRPWGSYTVLEKGQGYKIKRVVVNPGSRLSLQRHARRNEHWVVVEGTASVTRDTDTFVIRTNESTYIPAGVKHRLENRGEGLLQIIEVQNGDYLEEDDIERFADDYGR
jgi:mannose-1-phosphate guanylyltransferase / mannose-6-phosphate isomerase